MCVSLRGGGVYKEGRKGLLRAFRNNWRGRLDVGLWLPAFFGKKRLVREEREGGVGGVGGSEKNVGWVWCDGRMYSIEVEMFAPGVGDRGSGGGSVRGWVTRGNGGYPGCCREVARDWEIP